MNRIIATVAFIIICNISFAYNTPIHLYKKITTTDTTTNLIMQLDFDSFRGKPIDSFLIKLPPNYSDISMHSAFGKGPGHLSISYPNGNYVVVYIQRPICCISNPQANPLQWSLNEFRMEKAADITLYDGVTCLKGCYPYKEYN